MKIAITAAIKSADDAEANKETAKRKTEITDDASVAASAARVNTYADSAIEKQNLRWQLSMRYFLTQVTKKFSTLKRNHPKSPVKVKTAIHHVPSVPGWPRRDDEDEEEGYKRTKYTVDDGSIVLVTYETGRSLSSTTIRLM